MSIRAATEKDIPAMLAIYAPYVENTTWSFEYDVPCSKTFTRRFYEHIDQFPWLVWEEEGTVLGYAYAGAPFGRAAYRWDAESSIYLAPQAQGRGVGRALYAALEQILIRQGYRNLYAIITAENTGSLEFHRKVGFEPMALFPDCGYKHGKWLGVAWLRKQLAPLGEPTAFPKKWTDLEHNFFQLL